MQVKSEANEILQYNPDSLSWRATLWWLLLNAFKHVWISVGERSLTWPTVLTKIHSDEPHIDGTLESCFRNPLKYNLTQTTPVRFWMLFVVPRGDWATAFATGLDLFSYLPVSRRCVGETWPIATVSHKTRRWTTEDQLRMPLKVLRTFLSTCLRKILHDVAPKLAEFPSSVNWPYGKPCDTAAPIKWIASGLSFAKECYRCLAGEEVEDKDDAYLKCPLKKTWGRCEWLLCSAAILRRVKLNRITRVGFLCPLTWRMGNHVTVFCPFQAGGSALASWGYPKIGARWVEHVA